jgi:hypothetical protein
MGARPSLRIGLGMDGRAEHGHDAHMCHDLVRPRGLEPPLVAQLAPQASASTNSATAAGRRRKPPRAGEGE